MAASTNGSELSSDCLDALCRHVISLAWLDANIEPQGSNGDRGRGEKVSGTFFLVESQSVR